MHIPVCGNGDVFTAEQAFSRQKQAGTDSIMIGRGAMGNPWIFREIKDMQKGNQPVSVSYEMKRLMINRHYRMMLESRPEWVAVREMRKHIGWYIGGLKGAAQFRAEINRCTEAANAIGMINKFFESMSIQEESE